MDCISVRYLYSLSCFILCVFKCQDTGHDCLKRLNGHKTMTAITFLLTNFQYSFVINVH